jgi:hypothetical protein
VTDTFNTPFFVGLEEFPLPADDERRLPHTRFTKRDLICWRCQRNFGNRHKELTEHLEVEFQEWKKEPDGNNGEPEQIEQHADEEGGGGGGEVEDAGEETE